MAIHSAISSLEVETENENPERSVLLFKLFICQNGLKTCQLKSIKMLKTGKNKEINWSDISRGKKNLGFTALADGNLQAEI